MRNRTKALLALLLAIAALLCAVGIGSVPINPTHAIRILGHKLFGASAEGIDANIISIFWSIRMPRAILAFLVGAALSASGVVMQSVLQNPLASSYTLGVSSGASLGASLVIVSGFSLLGAFTLPFASFLSGLGSVAVAILLATRLDRSLQNTTVILVGMVFSLFISAILTLLTTLNSNYLQQLVFWQMGSFSGSTWSKTGIVLGVLVFGGLLILFFHRELDILTFGEEQSRALGVEVKRTKLILMALAALLTGAAVCFTGTIGFVDLVAPHVCRRIFGPKHRWLVPMSMLVGGAFMALADMIARTALAPIDLPVGAITALVGAPFFAYIFFRKRREASL